jgi:hypothetical protein
LSGSSLSGQQRRGRLVSNNRGRYACRPET